MADWDEYGKLQNSKEARKTIADSILHYQTKLQSIAKDKQNEDLSPEVKKLLGDYASKDIQPTGDLLKLLETNDGNSMSNLIENLDFLNKALNLYEEDLKTVKSKLEEKNMGYFDGVQLIEKTLINISKARGILTQE